MKTYDYYKGSYYFIKLVAAFKHNKFMHGALN